MFENDLLELARSLPSGDQLNLALRRLALLSRRINSIGQEILLSSQCRHHQMIVNVATLGVCWAQFDFFVAQMSGRDLLSVVREKIVSLEKTISGLEEISNFVRSDQSKEEFRLVAKISAILAEEDSLQEAIGGLKGRRDLSEAAVANMTRHYQKRLDDLAARRAGLQETQAGMLKAKGVSIEAMEAELARLIEERDGLVFRQMVSSELVRT